MELSSDRPWLGIEKHPGWASADEDAGPTPQAPSHAAVAPHRSPSIDSGLSTIEDTTSEPVPPPAPTGELTIAAICAPGVSWQRRLFLVTATLAINLGLPFLNGVMLGFGEIFARAFIAPWIGLAPPVPMSRLSASPADVPPMASIPPTGVRSWFVRSTNKEKH